MPNPYYKGRPSDHNPHGAGVISGRRRGAAEAREQIAAELERDAAQLRQDAEDYADERSPLLDAQADALIDAARRIREGGGDAPEQITKEPTP